MHTHMYTDAHTCMHVHTDFIINVTDLLIYFTSLRKKRLDLVETMFQKQ